MIRTVVLPGCVDGVITGCILSVGRILGESAALLFTAGFGHVLNDFFTAITKPGATLTVALCLLCQGGRRIWGGLCHCLDFDGDDAVAEYRGRSGDKALWKGEEQ